MKLTDSIKLAVKGYKPADIKRLDESGLDTDTILALSGAGYTVNDVDELINIASKGPEQQEPPKEPEGKMPDNPDGQSGADDPDNVDYKQKFVDTMKLLEESQQTIMIFLTAILLKKWRWSKLICLSLKKAHLVLNVTLAKLTWSTKKSAPICVGVVMQLGLLLKQEVMMKIIT